MRYIRNLSSKNIGISVSILALVAVICASVYTNKVNPKSELSPTRPEKLLFLIFDQMRPDYINRYDLKNFKRLVLSGRNYPEAYTGHVGAITIVSHPVMTTGLAPKDLLWVDNVIWKKKGSIGKVTFGRRHY